MLTIAFLVSHAERPGRPPVEIKAAGSQFAQKMMERKAPAQAEMLPSRFSLASDLIFSEIQFMSMTCVVVLSNEECACWFI